VLTAADFSYQFLVRLLERSNTNVFENAIEISKEIMRGTEVTIGLFCMDQESESYFYFYACIYTFCLQDKARKKKIFKIPLHNLLN
jgi:hypothetical protein